MAGDGLGEETDRGETMWSEEDGDDQAWPMEQLAPAGTRQPNGGRWRATRQQPVEDATVRSKRPGGFGKQPRRARQTATHGGSGYLGLAVVTLRRLQPLT
ncbi:unnamed protein product [Arctogadus glacialis]